MQLQALDHLVDGLTVGVNGEAGQVVTIPGPHGIKAKKLVLIGTGEGVVDALAARRLGVSAARALGRLGVRPTVTAPRARTAMTAGVFGDAPELPEGAVDPLSPDHVVNLVRFLASPAAEGVNGQLFIVYGPTVTLVAAPTAEAQFSASGDAWDPADLSDTLRSYFADRDPERSFSAAIGLGDRD